MELVWVDAESRLKKIFKKDKIWSFLELVTQVYKYELGILDGFNHRRLSLGVIQEEIWVTSRRR